MATSQTQKQASKTIPWGKPRGTYLLPSDNLSNIRKKNNKASRDDSDYAEDHDWWGRSPVQYDYNNPVLRRLAQISRRLTHGTPDDKEAYFKSITEINNERDIKANKLQAFLNERRPMSLDQAWQQARQQNLTGKEDYKDDPKVGAATAYGVGVGLISRDRNGNLIRPTSPIDPTLALNGPISVKDAAALRVQHAQARAQYRQNLAAYNAANAAEQTARANWLRANSSAQLSLNEANRQTQRMLTRDLNRQIQALSDANFLKDNGIVFQPGADGNGGSYVNVNVTTPPPQEIPDIDASLESERKKRSNMA